MEVGAQALGQAEEQGATGSSGTVLFMTLARLLRGSSEGTHQPRAVKGVGGVGWG